MRRAPIWGALACAGLLSILSCDSSPTGVDPATVAHRLDLAITDSVISVGASTAVKAVLLNTAGERLAAEVAWGTHDASVVRVTADGDHATIYGLQPGTARIWAESRGKDNFIQVVVAGDAAHVSLAPAADTIPQGQTETFSFVVHDGQGHRIVNPALTWSTSDSRVATVSAQGVVTGVGIGTAQVAATVNGKSGFAQVTVIPTPVATVAVGPSPLTLAVGQQVGFQARPRDAAGNDLGARNVTWTSSHPTILMVDASGLGTAKMVGNVVVTATSEGISGTAQVSVVTQGDLIVKVTPVARSIELAETLKFSASLSDAQGNAVTGIPVTWLTSNTFIASMAADGVATGVNPGTVVITAVANGRTGNTELAVNSPLPALASISPDTATAGRPTDMVLTVRGSRFTRQSLVRWNGTDRPTTYVGDTQLQAIIPASDLAAPRTSQVTVFTRSPGGGTSGAVPFLIRNSGTLTLGETLSGNLQGPSQVDEYTFAGNPGQEVNLYLRSMSGDGNEEICARILNPSAQEEGRACSDGNDGALGGQGDGPIRLRSGTYKLRIGGYYGTERGPYEVLVNLIPLAPEAAAPLVSLGAVVSGETLAPGDIDHFTFNGNRGQEINVFLQAISGFRDDQLWLSVRAPDGTTAFSVHSEGDDQTLEGQGTRLQRLTQTGPYTFRVIGEDLWDEGPYKFQVVQINRAPESASPIIPSNTLVDGESVGPPGDVDEFTYTAPAKQEVNVFFQATAGASHTSLRLSVLNGAQESELASTYSEVGDQTLEARAISHIALSAGQIIRLRVTGYHGTERASYRFKIQPIQTAPESISATAPTNAIVEGETLAPGDVDEFTFNANHGQMLGLQFQARSGLWSDNLVIRLFDPAGEELTYIWSDGADPTLEGQAQRPFMLQRTGVYRLRVLGSEYDDQGPYRFKITL
jgi:uncharacterized protein YjdB